MLYYIILERVRFCKFTKSQRHSIISVLAHGCVGDSGSEDDMIMFILTPTVYYYLPRMTNNLLKLQWKNVHRQNALMGLNREVA